jgi:UDP-N-acetylmuramoyl-L-alanyl-D-glutamate--2,6-diaminopimelate ligase
MRLRELIRRAYPDLGGAAERLPDAEVTSVVQDARRTGPGALFVARVGARADGHAFAPQAAHAGAVAIAGGRDLAPGERVAGLPYVSVPDDRAAVARLAAALHDWPARRTRVVGVTGTDGKTTTSTLLWWLLQGAAPTALSSTASTRLGAEEAPPDGPFTTPEADAVQAFLAEAVRRGIARVVLESSSHGLALRRLDEIDYALAVWTTLSPEHLDFHGSYEAYRAAKAQLVRRAPHAVLNRDDEAYGFFAAEAAAVTSYGADARADWRLLGVRSGPARLELTVGSPDGRERSATLPMVGTYNAGNALAALAAAAHEGVDPGAAVERLATFPGVPGRMQVIRAEPFALIVDFAHTAPALTRALEATAPRAGRRIVVVGAAGERDPGKRGPLGAAAVRGADLAVFTEEDARSEDPAAILAAMAEGATAAGGREGHDFLRVADRREAIRRAVAAAEPGDVVLLAGKGHERTLARAAEVLPWDEAAEARAALEARGG